MNLKQQLELNKTIDDLLIRWEAIEERSRETGYNQEFIYRREGAEMALRELYRKMTGNSYHGESPQIEIPFEEQEDEEYTQSLFGADYV